jgi:hypothetical protein
LNSKLDFSARRAPVLVRLTARRRAHRELNFEFKLDFPSATHPGPGQAHRGASHPGQAHRGAAHAAHAAHTAHTALTALTALTAN